MVMWRNKVLKQLQVTDADTNSIKTHHDRYEMENRIINLNRKHFKKACSYEIYNNQTCELLPNNSMREKTNGSLDKNDCRDEDVRFFYFDPG